MIKKSGNLFDTEQTCIGHGVNVYGVMGAGIAKQFKKLFPANYRAYQHQCITKQLTPGGLYTHWENNHFVLNMASQDKPGANARGDWLFAAALKAGKFASVGGYRAVAIPMIGCGIGGLTWPNVERILLNAENLTGTEFEVWKFDDGS